MFPFSRLKKTAGKKLSKSFFPMRITSVFLPLLGGGILLTLFLILYLALTPAAPSAAETVSPPETSSAGESQAQQDTAARTGYVPESSSSPSAQGEAFAGEDTSSLTEEDAAAALNSLREIFPEGSYWNHVGEEDWDPFTVTDIPCQHDLYGDICCNTYSGSIQDLFPQFDPMEQCLGFAAFVSDLVFGEDAPVEVFTDYTQLRPGDHIRLELTEHSMIVLTVEEDGITVLECNSDYEHCRISWDRFLDWDTLAAYSYEMECITRYGEN